MSDLKELILQKNKTIKEKDYIKISVSNIKDLLHAPFESEKKARACHIKGKDDPDNKYYGQSTDDILDLWESKRDRAANNGKIVDGYTEVIFEGKGEPVNYKNKFSDPDTLFKLGGVEKAAEFLRQGGFNFLFREIKLEMPFTVGKKKFLLNGRLDAFFEGADRYLLVDWKNNDVISTEGFRGEKMYGPLRDFDNCDINLFTVQLYLYIYMLKHQYGIDKPVSSCICQFPAGTPDVFYKMWAPNFPYDDNTIHEMIIWCIKKKMILEDIH